MAGEESRGEVEIMQQNTRYGENSVDKYKKRMKHWETYQNTVSFVGTMWSTTKPQKRSENGHLSRRIVISHSLGFADVFGRRSYPKRPKRCSLTRSPIPKVLIIRWKVLTSETPCKSLLSPLRNDAANEILSLHREPS